MRFTSGLCLLISFAVSQHLKADEPIMNMMPRWSGGWGYQFFYEHRRENDLLQGSSALHSGFSEEIKIIKFHLIYGSAAQILKCSVDISEIARAITRATSSFVNI